MRFCRQHLHLLNKNWGEDLFPCLNSLCSSPLKDFFFFNAHALNVLMFTYDCCLMNRIFITFKHVELTETAGKIL